MCTRKDMSTFPKKIFLMAGERQSREAKRKLSNLLERYPALRVSTGLKRCAVSRTYYTVCKLRVYGEEFGGKSRVKVRELRKLVGGFGCQVIQNHKGHCEENAHLERSHRTDDDEFYIPRALEIKSEADLLNEAMGYIYYYNNVREHSST